MPGLSRIVGIFNKTQGNDPGGRCGCLTCREMYRPPSRGPSQQDPKAKPEPKLSPKKRAALRKRWAQLIKLIRRVHQTDPLQCDCGGTYRVIAFITEPVTYCS